MDNREIISLHIGQAGIQMASALWELLRFEHELSADGHSHCYCPWPLQDNTHALYVQTERGQFKPRALLVDSEALVVDELRCGIGRNMFDSRSLICGIEDSGNVFANGYHTCADDVMRPVTEQLRASLEQSGILNGFMLFHSIGGGTGSGLTARLTETLIKEAPKKPMFHVIVTSPTEKCGFIVEPYNAVLALASLVETASLIFLLENDALYRTSARVSSELDSGKLSYVHINRRIAQISSSITTPYRFNNRLASDFGIYQTNLVPFPGIFFPVVSYAPSSMISDRSLKEMTKACFQSKNMTINVKAEQGCYFASCLLYRGMNCYPMVINEAAKSVKAEPNVSFVDWSPTGFKIAINVQMPGFVPCTNSENIRRSLCVLSNTTAISQTWRILLDKYHLLYDRKAYFHWFKNAGLDDETMVMAEKKLSDLIISYEDLAKCTHDSNIDIIKPANLASRPKHYDTPKSRKNSYISAEKKPSQPKEYTERKVSLKSETGTVKATTYSPNNADVEEHIKIESPKSFQKVPTKPTKDDTRVSTSMKSEVVSLENDVKPSITKPVPELILKESTESVVGQILSNSDSESESESESEAETETETESNSGTIKPNTKNKNACIQKPSPLSQKDSPISSSGPLKYIQLGKLTEDGYSLSGLSLDSQATTALFDHSDISFKSQSSGQFSLMLKHSILNLHEKCSQSNDKINAFQDRSLAKRFLSRFRRISSHLNVIEGLNDYFCGENDHLSCFNIPIDKLRGMSIFQAEIVDPELQIRDRTCLISDLNEDDCFLENQQLVSTNWLEDDVSEWIRSSVSTLRSVKHQLELHPSIIMKSQVQSHQPSSQTQRRHIGSNGDEQSSLSKLLNLEKPHRESVKEKVIRFFGRTKSLRKQSIKATENSSKCPTKSYSLLCRLINPKKSESSIELLSQEQPQYKGQSGDRILNLLVNQYVDNIINGI